VNVHDVLRRLRSGERWLAADLAIRALGCAVLALGTAAGWWLYRAVNRPPSHPATLGEFAAGFLVVVCWSCGWGAIGEGQGLFRLVEVPGRHARFDPHTIGGE